MNNRIGILILAPSSQIGALKTTASFALSSLEGEVTNAEELRRTPRQCKRPPGRTFLLSCHETRPCHGPLDLIPAIQAGSSEEFFSRCFTEAQGLRGPLKPVAKYSMRVRMCIFLKVSHPKCLPTSGDRKLLSTF